MDESTIYVLLIAVSVGILVALWIRIVKFAHRNDKTPSLHKVSIVKYWYRTNVGKLLCEECSDTFLLVNAATTRLLTYLNKLNTQVGYDKVIDARFEIHQHFGVEIWPLEPVTGATCSNCGKIFKLEEEDKQ